MERARMRDNAWTGYTEWLTPVRVAAELDVEYHRVLDWIARDDDPLPAVLIAGNRRSRRVNRKELNEWLQRNSKRVN